MSDPFTILLIGICIGVICTAAGAIFGGWLGHRARNNISPLPSVGGGAKALISIFQRGKRPATPKRRNMPPIHPMKV